MGYGSTDYHIYCYCCDSFHSQLSSANLMGPQVLRNWLVFSCKLVIQTWQLQLDNSHIWLVLPWHQIYLRKQNSFHVQLVIRQQPLKVNCWKEQAISATNGLHLKTLNMVMKLSSCKYSYVDLTLCRDIRAHPGNKFVGLRKTPTP